MLPFASLGSVLQHEVRTPRGRASVAAGVVDFENHQSAAVADLYPWGSAMAQRNFCWIGV